jgi:DNA-binding beta-propeller fold protein YncE
MRSSHALIRFGLGVSLTLALAGSAFGRDAGADEQNPAPRLVSVRSYAPQQFRQSRIDYLAGEFPRQFPYRIAADPQGRIFVTDPAVSSVHVFDTLNNKRWEIRGDRRHRLTKPAYIAADADGNLYVTDIGLSGVLVYDATGLFVRTIGSGEFSMPSGVWVDRPRRRLYVADCWRGEVLSFDLEGNPLRVFGSEGRGPGQFACPRDLTVQGDKLLVLDAGNFRFQILDLQGKVLGILPFGADRKPFAFALDGADNLYYADMYSGGLVAIDPNGKMLGELEGQREPGQWVERPSCPNFVSLTPDARGNILALRPSLRVEVVQIVGNTAR